MLGKYPPTPFPLRIRELSPSLERACWQRTKLLRSPLSEVLGLSRESTSPISLCGRRLCSKTAIFLIAQLLLALITWLPLLQSAWHVSGCPLLLEADRLQPCQGAWKNSGSKKGHIDCPTQTFPTMYCGCSRNQTSPPRLPAMKGGERAQHLTGGDAPSLHTSLNQGWLLGTQPPSSRTRGCTTVFVVPPVAGISLWVEGGFHGSDAGAVTNPAWRVRLGGEGQELPLCHGRESGWDEELPQHLQGRSVTGRGLHTCPITLGGKELSPASISPSCSQIKWAGNHFRWIWCSTFGSVSPSRPGAPTPM